MKKTMFVFIAVFLVFAALTAVSKDKMPNIQKEYWGKETAHTPRSTHTRASVTDILTEDFSSGLPAGWENIDHEGEGQIWEFDNPAGRTFNSTTNANGFAILDSDEYGSGHTQDADLITSAIDCSSFTGYEITLEFEHYYRHYASSATVSVSGNNGASWTDLQTWTSTIPTNATLLSYDITAIAAGSSQVKVMWHYTGTYGYYWCVDDVHIYAEEVVTPPECAMQIQPDQAEDGVDINTALMWESGGGGPTAYYLYFGTDNPPTNIVNGTDQYPNTSYIPATLNFGTTYYWQVVPSNDNGDALDCPVWSFTTYSPLTLPYSQDFEAAAPYWYIVNENGDNQNWSLYTGFPNSGSYSAGINSNTPSTADDWAYTPAFDFTPGSTYQLMCYYAALYGSQTFSIWWGDSQNSASMVNPILGGILPENGAYEPFAIEFTPTGAGPFFIGMNYATPGTDGTDTFLMLDDILIQEVTAAPDCPVLVAPVAGVTGASTMPTLSWTHANNVPLGYNIYFGTDDPPTNIYNGVNIGFTDEFPISSPLPYETTYYWYVEAYNGKGVSSGCTTESFTTMEDQTIYSGDLPYNQGFENGGAIPFGWTQDFVNGTNDWTFQYGGEDGNPGAPHSGSYNACFYYGNSSTMYRTRLITPMIDFTDVASPFLDYYHCQFEWSPDQDELRVYYKNSPSGAWTLLPGQEFTTSIESWTHESVELPNPTSTYWIAFDALQGYGYGACVDDVMIYNVGSAPDPASNPTPIIGATNIGYHTNLSWSAAAGANGYRMSMWYDDGTRANNYICQDKDLGNVTSYDPSDDGFDDLLYGMTYYWEVVPYNNNGLASDCPDWYFTVEADPFDTTLPWSEDFENGGNMPSAWTQEYNMGTNDWTFRNGGGSNNPSSAHSGEYNACLSLASYTNTSTKLITPQLDFTGVGCAHMTFAHAQVPWGSDQDVLTVYYKNTAGGAWNELQYYDGAVATWQVRVIDLPNLSSTYWIAFEGLTDYGYGVCIDDVMVSESPATAENTFITEVCDNKTGENEATGYIELKTNVGYTVDLSGFQIRVGTDDGMGNFTPTGTYYTIPDGTTIRPGYFLLIGGGADYAAFTAAWGITETVNYISGSTTLGLTSGAAYDLFDPTTRASSLGSTPNVPADTKFVHNTEDEWLTDDSDNGTPGALDPGQTLPVTFASFMAAPSNTGSVLLTWSVQTESDMQGYHVLRSETPEVADAIRLTPSMIEAFNTTQESGYTFEDTDTEENTMYFYWIESYQNNGYSSFHGPVSAIVTEDGEIPVPVCEVTNLRGNFPNPFNPQTDIKFSIKGTYGDLVKASLTIYNIKGQKVKTLFTERVVTGDDHIVWRGDDSTGRPVASGIYFYRLKTSDYSEIRKMMLLK